MTAVTSGSFPAVAEPRIKPETTPASDIALREAAQALEATFLAEMLKSAGFGKARESFGGGAGEDHFASFMIQEQAKQIVASGGIGLAEQLFTALKDRNADG